MERLAGQILRVDGSYRGIKASASTKHRMYQNSKYKLTAEDLKVMRDAFK
jgi:hypothetical protein